MAWTYTNDPQNVPVDRVRLYIGDTDPEDQQFSNEEINFFLSQASGSATRAAVNACRNLITKYARFVDSKIESIAISNQQRVENYQRCVQELEELDQSVGTDPMGVPYVGGVSISETDANNQNNDRTPSQFRTDMFRNPRTGNVADLDDRLV